MSEGEISALCPKKGKVKTKEIIQSLDVLHALAIDKWL